MFSNNHDIPPYSPKLNPVETFWAYFKGTILKGITPKNLTELKQMVIEKLEMLKNDTAFLQNFFRD